MNAQAALAITVARTRLLFHHPFVGSLATRLNMVEDVNTATMSVDGRTIRYNPDFVNGNSTGLNQAIVAHEVFHCVFDHVNRLNGRNPRKWNQAGDYVINWELTQAGFDFEGTGLLDAKYADMTTDAIYNLLVDEDGDAGDPLDEMIHSVPGDGSTPDADATEWKVAVIQAANAAKEMGKLPANLERFVTQITAPKVDWRTVLQRFVSETNRDDFSWTRPNKRFMAYDLYLPSLWSENMGEIVVAIDTSGSIDNNTLNAFGSEIQAIVDMARPSKTTVIYCDAGVNHVDEFAPGDTLTFKMHGGGGTDFRPPFEHVRKNGITPVCFVYLTDMYGPFPQDPGYPVMWCATSDIQGPFGQTIRLDLR